MGVGKTLLKIGGVVAAGAVCCVTGGLAAPAIGGLVGGAMGLSGAAATSAGLAAIGGGSLAAGGLGMAGGTAVIASSAGAVGASAAAAAVAKGNKGKTSKKNCSEKEKNKFLKEHNR